MWLFTVWKKKTDCQHLIVHISFFLSFPHCFPGLLLPPLSFFLSTLPCFLNAICCFVSKYFSLNSLSSFHSHLLVIMSFHPSFIHFCLSFFLYFLVSLLVIGSAALPLAGVVHARSADGAGDEVSGPWGHEVSHCRRDVHPLVCHQVICRAKTKISFIQPNHA